MPYDQTTKNDLSAAISAAESTLDAKQLAVDQAQGVIDQNTTDLTKANQDLAAAAQAQLDAQGRITTLTAAQPANASTLASVTTDRDTAKKDLQAKIDADIAYDQANRPS